MLQPAYTPLFDTVLAFAARPEYESELTSARIAFARHTGEIFDDDRSFEPRMQAFLDWYLFDRPLEPYGEPPVRAYPIVNKLAPEAAEPFRLMSRTVHGIFEFAQVHADAVTVRNVLTLARYKVINRGPLAGVIKGDLFEGRLVPFEGGYHFSTAFIFHPRSMRSRIVRALSRSVRGDSPEPVQEAIFTLSRMAGRAERYRNVPMKSVYDFARPPPKVDAAPMKFDPASVAGRLGRLLPPPDDEVSAPVVREG